MIIFAWAKQSSRHGWYHPLRSRVSCSLHTWRRHFPLKKRPRLLVLVWQRIDVVRDFSVRAVAVLGRGKRPRGSTRPRR